MCDVYVRSSLTFGAESLKITVSANSGICPAFNIWWTVDENNKDHMARVKSHGVSIDKVLVSHFSAPLVSD